MFYITSADATQAPQVTLVVKNPPANAGDLRDAGLIPGSGRSPGGGHGNPFQYFFYDLPLSILFFNSIFNWRITALQYCDGFCHTWTWISHMHKCVPSVLNLPHPIPQNCHRVHACTYCCMHAKSSPLCPTFCDTMDWGPPGSSVHGILQVKIQEWVAMPSSRESSWPRDQTSIFCTVGRFSTQWATWEGH